MNSGALYVALGDRYIEAAITSARSLKAVMPDCPVALVSDRKPLNDFDVALHVESGDGYRAKIIGICKSPFKQTVFLDVDTHVVSDIGPIFELLGQFDVALAHAPNRVTTALADVPDSFPEFNTGVIGYRRNRVTRRIFHRWLVEYDRLGETLSKDQPSFRWVVFQDRRVRIATLTSEFNQRFTMAGYMNQHVRILHGWADPATYENVARAMNEQLELYYDHAVFANGQLFDRQGNAVAKWPVT